MDRNAFLERVKQAVQAGNRAGGAPALAPRGNVGYQGAGNDPYQRMCETFQAAGGVPHPVRDDASAVEEILEIIRTAKSPVKRVLLGQGKVLERLPFLVARLQELSVEVVETANLKPETARDAFFDTDLGISGVDYLVAETGSLALACKPEETRSESLLPPVHIAVAERGQLVPDLFDLFARFPPLPGNDRPELPSCLTLVTGPSKTGDIELRLVTGVHGPGIVHLVLINV
ncbi:MAG: lactate utilization protein C [Gemmataceae bacterium]